MRLHSSSHSVSFFFLPSSFSFLSVSRDPSLLLRSPSPTYSLLFSPSLFSVFPFTPFLEGVFTHSLLFLALLFLSLLPLFLYVSLRGSPVFAWLTLCVSFYLYALCFFLRLSIHCSLLHLLSALLFLKANGGETDRDDRVSSAHTSTHTVFSPRRSFLHDGRF